MIQMIELEDLLKSTYPYFSNHLFLIYGSGPISNTNYQQMQREIDQHRLFQLKMY
jgi:hypothetical protein